MSEYKKIFVSFFKIGLFTFGGGYAMMPLFRRELIEKHHYITENELVDYYSVGQCTPGIIAVNVSTFAGYKVKGTKGAILATFAMVLPSLIIILMLAGMLSVFSENKIIAHAFAGIRLGVIALILNEVLNLFKKAVPNKFYLSIFIAILLLVLFVKFSAVAVVLVAVCAGIVRWMCKK